MTLSERIEHAARAEKALDELRVLSEDLHTEGLTKQAIADAFYAVFVQHRERLDDDQMSDAIADCLDFLTGYCASHARILPDEPDAKF